MRGAQPASSNRPVGVVLEDVLLPLHVTYGQEIAKLKMQVLRYRDALIAHGIEPPDSEGKDLLAMWEGCKAVIAAAQNCVAELGTSKELLSEKWR